MGAPQQVLVAGGGENSLYRIISSLGLTTNLQLCLDAAAIGSWPGSGTLWRDLTPNGNNVFLGTNGSTSAPTFNGTPGKLSASEYWTGSGTFFTATSQPTFANNLHKSGNASTVLAIIYPTSTAYDYCGDNGTSVSVGMDYGLTAVPKQILEISNGSNVSPAPTGANTITTSVWHFLAASITDSASSISFLYEDGAYDQVSGSDTFVGQYTSPSSAASTYTFQVAAGGNNVRPIPDATSRMAAFCCWQGTMLSKANVDSIYSAVKTARPGYSLP